MTINIFCDTIDLFDIVKIYTKEGFILKKFYTIEIAGLKRDLQLFKISDNLQIAASISDASE